MSDVPEKSLERYDVLDRIAVGGMAEVFLAKAYGAHGFEKTLAIKRILPELARDPEFEERFIAEAKVAVKLSHTNVVQVFDFGRFSGSLFIAMEYVDGLDLAALLRRLRDRGMKMPVAAAFQIAIELSRGLDFAHTHGVVHRDVSPSNILLSRAGEVKIADFGIAVAAQPQRAPGGGRRKVMGKWRYMSPEQARGEPVDTKSDMFSAAAVMYELFTQEKLFPGDEAEDIIRNIAEMPLPKPSQVRPGLPAKLDDILHHALARLPDQRPARPAVMLRALTELTYESSIISTALDVAEVVSDALDTATPTGKRLDAIIRAQLANMAQESSQVRRTARGDAERKTADATSPPALTAGDVLTADRLTAITKVHRHRRPSESGAHEAIDESVPVLKSTVGADGLTRLELDETTIAGAEWLRPGEPPPMPAAPSPAASLTQAVTVPPPPSRRGWVVGGVGAAAVAAIAVVAWPRSRAAAPPPAAPIAVIDAAPPRPLPATLVVESVPAGARGTIGAQAIAATPVTLEVPAGQPLVLKLELDGYRPYLDERVEVGAGQTLRIRAAMVVAGARLVITSEPAGAAVTVDGADVGVTPLTLDDLPAHTARIGLAKAGFVSATASVELSAGREAKLARTLKPAPAPMGAIALQVVDGWGEVYLGGKKIGQAPAKSLALPIGHHHLRIVNPPTGRVVELDVDVTADGPRYYQVRFP
ncbi:MAG: serine/threonine protein kinase [Myxococcales bacterium]|nr:serine/threonine protein kinase [Myxococcales bacterium]